MAAASHSSSDPPGAAPGKTGLSSFDARFWICNTIEMWERLSYYTLRPVAPIYIMQATEPGGLHLTAAHKGTIYLWWAVFQSIFPIVTGGFADRYGYKNMLALSIVLNIIGYLLMGLYPTYEGFFTGVLVLAFGTAFFKPSIQATLSANLTKSNSSLGWGVFYWVVNVGSTIGHYISPVLLGNPHSAQGWQTLFFTCAGFTAMNFILLFFVVEPPSGASKTESPFSLLWRTLTNIVEPRLLAWILIMSCFWMMMYQLWDTQPNFIEDWVDSSALAALLPQDSHYVETGDMGLKRVPQQILISLNALMIVFLVVPVSALAGRMRTLSAMFWGMLGATAGVLVAGLTGNGWILLAGIVLFSLGEMLTGPKKSEYLSLIAPAGKRGLYLGYVNIPTGLGQGIGNKISAYVYDNFGEKARLAQKYLLEHTSMGEGKVWDGDVGKLDAVLGVPRTRAFATLQELLGKDGVETTRILWDTYDPHLHVWLPFAAIGVVAAVALYIYGKMAQRWSDMNA